MSLPDVILDALKGRSALVTGGTGMIGREVVRLLCDAGCEVTSVSLDEITVDSRARYVKGDLADFNFCMDLTKDTDLLLHVAGIKGSVVVTQERPADFMVPLLMMNTNILEAARRNGAQKILYTSTIGAYAPAEVFAEDDYDVASEPMDAYAGWAKRVAELQVQAYAHQYKMEHLAVVRPCNVYGPGDSFRPESAMVVPSLMSRVAAGEAPLKVWGDGSAIRDFAFSRDVARGIIHALHYGTRGSFVNLGSGRGVSIKELVETMAAIGGFEFVFDTSKPAGYPRRVMDVSRAEEWIDWTPSTSLHDGLTETWEWFTANPTEYLKRQNYFR